MGSLIGARALHKPEMMLELQKRRLLRNSAFVAHFSDLFPALYSNKYMAPMLRDSIELYTILFADT